MGTLRIAPIRLPIEQPVCSLHALLIERTSFGVMKLSRRTLTFGSLSSLVGFATAGRARAQSSSASLPAHFRGRELPNRVAAGDVTDSSAVVWARPARFGLVIFQLSRSESFRFSRYRIGFARRGGLPMKAVFDRLRPGTTYHYRVFSGFGNASTGRFETAAEPTSKRVGLRFGVTGDQRGELAPYPSVRNAVDRELQLFIELGDTIYADFPSPNVPAAQAESFGEFVSKNEEVYADRQGLNTLAELRSQVAWMATIDDHEVTNDFAGGADPSTDPRFTSNGEQFINETALYRNGLRAFELFQPVEPQVYKGTGDSRVDGRPKLYRNRQYGTDAAFFLLDARSFRDAPLPPVTDVSDLAQVQQFLAASFDPSRTLLGRPQLEELKADLLAAEAAGVLWKFVMVPEPIQNLGPLAASDRYEGYAAERNELLAFIDQSGIQNVAFICADLHGTLVNNLTYQTNPLAAPTPVAAFEIVTGSVAFDAPFGPTLFQIAAGLGLVDPATIAAYNAAPRDAKDTLILKPLIDATLQQFGYPRLGLDVDNAGPKSVQATLVSGDYVRTHTYGWSEFDIDAATGQLTVTTYGIDPYTQAEIESDPTVLERKPAVVSQFTVDPR